MGKVDERSYRSDGFGILSWLLAIPLGIVILLASAFIVFEARKWYWDSYVKELCSNDGGISIYEAVTITPAEHKWLKGVPGGIAIPHESAKRTDFPYFRQTFNTSIRKWNPEIVRNETVVRRRSDGKVLGRAVQYWRRGGDFPTGIFHESSFLCPREVNLGREIFKVEILK